MSSRLTRRLLLEDGNGSRAILEEKSVVVAVAAPVCGATSRHHTPGVLGPCALPVDHDGPHDDGVGWSAERSAPQGVDLEVRVIEIVLGDPVGESDVRGKLFWLNRADARELVKFLLETLGPGP